MAAYQAAANGTPPPTGAGRTVPGTINALVVAWYQSAGFLQLSASTKATYRGIVERFRAEHGSKAVATLEAVHIRKLIAAKIETPAAANNLLRMIRILTRFALEEGWRRDDPALAVRRIRSRSSGFHTWTDDEIATFEGRWPLGTRERLALALLMFTGQRRGDVIRMGRQHIRATGIEVVQGKTGTRLTIPVHPALREALAAWPSNHLTFLVTRDGAPFTAAGFGNWFRQACNAAGLPKRCSSHGLRKAVARQLAEAGHSTRQIMAVGGWKSMSEVERYTRAASQQRLAEATVPSLGRRKSNES